MDLDFSRGILPCQGLLILTHVLPGMYNKRCCCEYISHPMPTNIATITRAPFVPNKYQHMANIITPNNMGRFFSKNYGAVF